MGVIKIIDSEGQYKELLPIENNEDLAELITGLVAGDIVYFDGTNLVRLPIGTAGQTLKVNGAATAPEWVT
ncbi:MAG: hypothetical protein ACNA7X_04335 [Dehalococcoidia bacterium]